MSIILALETATAACSVALSLNGEMYSRFEIVPGGHSEIILCLVDSLFKQVGVDLKAIDAVAFGCGPGSFMGVRLAVGVAQGIAYGIGCPVISVSSLQALAQTTYQKIQSARVLAGWDARMKSVYWGGYQVDDHGIMQVVIPDQLSDPTAVKVSDGEWVAAGNAWAIYPELLSLPVKHISSETYPEATSVAVIANEKFACGECLPPQQGEPAYLREQVARKPVG